MIQRASDHAKTRADVIVVGGGASGVPAALQAARMGAAVLLIEETPWLGGMLTAAGVSALDGNDDIHSGIHHEFVQALWDIYGGRDAVRTAWVSNTLFEPRVGQDVLRRFVDAEPGITLWLGTRVAEILREGDRVLGVVTADGREARAWVTIEATEWGDVLALSGAAHRFGREARSETGEAVAPDEADDIIQDFTQCLTLRDFGPGADRTVPAPSGYDPRLYDGSVKEFIRTSQEFPFRLHTLDEVLSYGRLPNGKMMLNWPNRGNDFFAPEIVLMPPGERPAAFQTLKRHALGFLHYLQTVCGCENWGIDRDDHPTSDGLPLIPYVRESRRAEATVTMHLSDVVDRYANPERPLHRTGVAVGDYFIDHHHNALLLTDRQPKLCRDHLFPPIQAVSVPLGCLIPLTMDGLIAAEKSIGVTHAVNGVTRLQPIVMNIGQAAGALAALAARRQQQPRGVDPRAVQQALLDAGALLMPFADAGIDHPQFQAIQRVALSGLMRGVESPRHCEFRPDETVTPDLLSEIHGALRATGIAADRFEEFEGMTRATLATELDHRVDPFHRVDLNIPSLTHS